MISFSAHRANFREFPEVCRLGRKLRVSRVWADRVVPLGSGAELREQVLTPEETCEFFHIMREARREAAAPSMSARWASPDAQVRSVRISRYLLNNLPPAMRIPAPGDV